MKEPTLDWIREQLLRGERWLGRRFLADPFLTGNRRVLFVLGHMRSGSSLLVHILTSHRDIVGYGETHNVYTNPEDFVATAAKVYRYLRSMPGDEHYLLDKALHEYLIVRERVLEHPAVRVIFLVRRPDAALSSMVQNEVVSEGEEAHQHYVQQTEWMRRLSERLSPRRWTHTTYTELIQRTGDLFSRLESFLDLSVPLSERYDTNRYTGKRKIGDSGPHIEAGHIKRDIDREVDPRIQPYLRHADEAFEKCRDALRDGQELD